MKRIEVNYIEKTFTIFSSSGDVEKHEWLLSNEADERLGFEIIMGSDFDLIRIFPENIFIEEVRTRMVVGKQKEEYLKSII